MPRSQRIVQWREPKLFPWCICEQSGDSHQGSAVYQCHNIRGMYVVTGWTFDVVGLCSVANVPGGGSWDCSSVILLDVCCVTLQLRAHLGATYHLCCPVVLWCYILLRFFLSGSLGFVVLPLRFLSGSNLVAVSAIYHMSIFWPLSGLMWPWTSTLHGSSWSQTWAATFASELFFPKVSSKVMPEIRVPLAMNNLFLFCWNFISAKRC